VTKRIALALALLIALGVAAFYFPLDFLRKPMARALERSLGRKVEVGNVYLNLFGAPGLTLEDVTIHEDPRAGIEPFAYVASLKAGISLMSLPRRRLLLSSLNLGDDADINLVKTESGAWNFQWLPILEGGDRGALPSIRMRGGRVNFKFGDTKSVFYFSDADLDVSPYGKGSAEIRFGGAPSRTDRSGQDFGHLFVRGNWSGPATRRLDATVEWEQCSLDELTRMIDPRGFGVQGVVSLEAQLGGALAALQVHGQIKAEELHRWDQLPLPGSWALPLQGTLDLTTQKLQLASAESAPDSQAPIALEFHGQDFLTKPVWNAGVRFDRLPLAALIDIARHAGLALPDTLAAEGTVSGQASYTQQAGLSGALEARDAVLKLPGTEETPEPLRAPLARIVIGDGAMHLETTTVAIGEKESAEVEGDYTLEAPRALNLRISTRGMSVANMRSFGLAAIPVLDRAAQGSWRGWAQYRGGEWSGDYDLQNARIAVDGLAEPLHVQSASVKLSGRSAAVSKLHARVGQIAFTGAYRWEPDAIRPHRFEIAIAKADGAELARVLAPTLERERGFLARTLRLGPAPTPEWLKKRRADGTLAIDALTAGNFSLRNASARLLWDGLVMRLADFQARIAEGNSDSASVAGDIDISLNSRASHFKFDGAVAGVPYKGGWLDFEGSLETDGLGAQMLETARGEGGLRGRAIAFAPDAEFRSAAACFKLEGLQWKLSDVEVVQGGDFYTGSGASQPDGKLVLDLVRPGRGDVRFFVED